MPLSEYLNSARNLIRQQLRLEGGVTIHALDGTYTLTAKSPNIGALDPDGSHRTFQLPAVGECKGFFGFYKNSGNNSNNLTFLDADAVEVVVLGDTEWCLLACDGVAWTAFSSSAFGDLLATANTWALLQTFTSGFSAVGASIVGPLSSPMTAAQTLAGSGTITLPTTGINKALSSASAVTGIILTAGTVAGQLLYLQNVNAADSITFDTTPATSRVAQSVCALAAGTGKWFSWNATTSRWAASSQAVITAGTAPAFTGTAAASATADAFTGTGFATAGQVVTTSDNQTMTLNQCAGMWLITATKAPSLILSNTAVTGAPAVLTVMGEAPTTAAEAYKILRAPTPAGTVASHTHAL